MIRGHQFNKVEMFQYTLPEDSDEAFEELVKKASDLMAGLGLHYRVSKLAAGDVSASMARTYDVEVWIPSMQDYKEISSASNARSYQARRGNIRYRDPETGKNEYVHTLNASGLATSRVFPPSWNKINKLMARWSFQILRPGWVVWKLSRNPKSLQKSLTSY